MSTVKLIWTGEREALETLGMVLTEVLWPPADAVSVLKDDAAKTETEADWSLHAYFTERPEDGDLAALAASEGLVVVGPTQEDLPDIDWVAHALEGLGVVEAGAFIVFGRHDKEQAEASGLLPIQVEANRAFGTGHHPTTAGCLSALTALRDRRAGKILDVGTGSGVLAIGARRLFPEALILGTDLDRPSVDIARENAATNGITDLDLAEAEGVGPMARDLGPFDLVFANILAEPLITLAPDLKSVLAPDGRLIIAGLLARQEAAVTDAYTKAGLTIVGRIDDPTWPVLTLGHAQ